MCSLDEVSRQALGAGEPEANLLDASYGGEAGKPAGSVVLVPGWGMLVEGTGKLPPSLLLLGALVAFPSPFAVSIAISPRRPVPLRAFPQPLRSRIFFVVVAPSPLGAAASSAAGTATTARGAVAAAVVFRREILVKPLHDYDHDTVYYLLLPSLERSLVQLLRIKVTARPLVVTITGKLASPSPLGMGCRKEI